MGNKLTLSYVAEVFASMGYTLLSNIYINNTIKLDYMCNKGHRHSMTYANFSKGRRCPTCMAENRLNSNHHNWTGGKFALYKDFCGKLSPYNAVSSLESAGQLLLAVNCAYCGSIFTPTSAMVRRRLYALEGKASGEQNFYCSKSCKQACPTYSQKKYPKNYIYGLAREVQPELRQLVFARDSYTCQICGAASTKASLHCHHILPVSFNPIESADLDVCICLCDSCHKYVHTLPGCTYSDLRCKN